MPFVDLLTDVQQVFVSDYAAVLCVLHFLLQELDVSHLQDGNQNSINIVDFLETNNRFRLKVQIKDTELKLSTDK